MLLFLFVGEALKANITTLGPLVRPVSEQLVGATQPRSNMCCLFFMLRLQPTGEALRANITTLGPLVLH
jgi:hypothetical protein